MARCNSCNQNNTPVMQPVDCPTPINCDEVMDALCVLYTGDKINLCLTGEVVINRLDNLSEILQILVDKVCSLEQKNIVNVEILHNNSGQPFPTLVSQVTGGVGPYTYQWRRASSVVVVGTTFIDPTTVMGGHRVIGSTTGPSLNLDAINVMGIESKYDMDNIKFSYVELVVTDSLSNKGNAYYRYTSSCYEAIPVVSTPRPQYIGANLKTNTGYPTGTFKFPALDFCDTYNRMTTCDDLKNIYCIPGYEYGVDADTQYRSERSAYVQDLNENLLSSEIGVPTSQLTDLQPQIDSLDDLAQLLRYRPEGFMTFSYLDSCPQCTKEAWNVITYNGYTLSQIFPTFTNPNCDFYWIQQQSSFPSSGQPGQLFIQESNPGVTYAWNPLISNWDLSLGSLIVDNFKEYTLQSVYKQRLFDFLQVHLTFIQSNLYAPLHRWKYNTMTYNQCSCD